MKQATAWRADSGRDVVTNTNDGFSLLLETGFHLLLETNFRFMFEDSVVTPVHPTSWTDTSKPISSWEARDGFSTATVDSGSTRLTSQGDIRVTEQGDTRLTEDSTFVTKLPAVWGEL